MLPSDDDVVSQGFQPLRRAPTMPSKLPQGNATKGDTTSGSGRRVSFCDVVTGEMENAQVLWENSPWGKMERGMGRLERGNSFVGGGGAASKEGLVAIVDPFSTGANLAAQAAALGFGVVRVLSIWDSPVAALIQEGVTVDYFATVQFNDQALDQDDATNQCVRDLQHLPRPVIAVLAGAETGVELADRLAHRMGLRSNGEDGSFARRNKYAMGEKVRASGTRAVKQRLCRSTQELHDYLKDDLGIAPGVSSERCVVKPVQSAGSDCVYLCASYDEAVEAFGMINGKRNGLGLINDGALVQEFLSGKEYVIDKVSRNGVHKVVAVWEYDKRMCNGHNFIYFGNRLRPSDSERAQEMIRYADQVLDALDISQGPSHMEVMYTASGPCLVEVGSRCQGGEGTWLPIVTECIGYSQVDLTLDVYLGGQLFDLIPKDSYTLKKAGRDVDLVSRHAGIVRALAGDAIIRSLPSFRAVSWEIQPGDFCPVTVDCFTRPGCVQLVSESEEQADADFERLHELEEMLLIDYSIMCPKPPLTGAVVVVDPFSTGAHLAATVLRWGYKLILVFSSQDKSGGRARVMSDGHIGLSGGIEGGSASEIETTTSVGSISYMKPSLLVQHASFEKDQVKALSDTVAAVRALEASAPILAVLAGAETGVELADRLSEAMGTRSNGSKTAFLRQSKHASAAAVEAKGLHTPLQCLAVSEEDVSAFWGRVTSNGGSRIVIKPDNSIEGDSVFLCDSLEASIGAFQKIFGQFNMLSRVNEGVLCMERIKGGTEYIVDTVSRRGESKIVAIWECDKTAVTPALTMVYGMRLRDLSYDSEIVGALAQAVETALGAVGVVHGPAHTKFIVDAGKVAFLTSRACFQAGDASWLQVAKTCVGYDIIETTLNAYLRPDQYDAIEKVPSKLIKQGMDVNLLSLHSGTVKSIPGMAAVRALPSVACVVLFTQPGSHISRTTNRMSRAGSVQLIAGDEDELESDYVRLKELQLSDMMFELM